MKNPTKKQEETLREFLHSAVVPLIEDVLVKKLGQAMSYAKEQLAPPSKPDVNQELLEALKSVHSICNSDLQYRQFPSSREYEIINICKPLIAKHKEQA